MKSVQSDHNVTIKEIFTNSTGEGWDKKQSNSWNIVFEIKLCQKKYCKRKYSLKMAA